MKYILTFLQIFIFHVASSQFVITNLQFPAVGDSTFITRLDTLNFNPGNSGQNVLWDFSGIQKTSQDINPKVYSTHIGIPYASNIRSDYSFASTFYKTDSFDFSYIGYTNLNTHLWGTEVSFSNYEILLHTPMNYLDTYTDSFAATMHYYSSTQNYTTDFVGTITKLYDGYGELRLPWGVYSNIARLQVTRIQVDTLGNIETVNGYEWYDENTHDCVLKYTQTATGTNTFSSLTSQSRTIVGVFELEKNEKLSVYPNPSMGNFKIVVPDIFKGERNLTVKIYDLSANLIFQKFVSTEKEIEIHLASIASGDYHVVLGNGKISFQNVITLSLR